MQEREYAAEDRAFHDEVFGEDQPGSKGKDESKGDASPETKRRKTQEEEDWPDEFWKSTDIVSRDFGVVERGEIEDRVTKWIQEIERVVEESVDHMEELDLEDYGGA
eukprot:9646078-Karenia_brevis.AAC.1